MPKPSYEFVASPNFARRTKPITAVVIHYTASMGIDGVIDWFKRRESQDSAHYVVGRDGRVVQRWCGTATWHGTRDGRC